MCVNSKGYGDVRGILFKPFNKTVAVDKPMSVLDLALKNKIPISTSCGGSGSCGACRVFVEGELPPRNDVEQAMADDRGFVPNERLSCQIDACEGLVITVP